MNCAPTARTTSLPSALSARRAVLITRPEPAAQRSAALLEGLGWRCLIAPMLDVSPCPPLPPQHAVQAVVVTSANALPALVDLDHATPLFAVGDATADAARQAGFDRVRSAGRDAVALADLVATTFLPAAGALLLASGEGQGMALAGDLRARGFVVRRRVTYRRQAVNQLPPEVACALLRGDIGHAMFFSADTARAFAQCVAGQADGVNAALRQTEALVISQAVAQAISFLPWRVIRVASHPNQDEMVALLP